jgi:hypothetical protein
VAVAVPTTKLIKDLAVVITLDEHISRTSLVESRPMRVNDNIELVIRSHTKTGQGVMLSFLFNCVMEVSECSLLLRAIPHLLLR